MTTKTPTTMFEYMSVQRIHIPGTPYENAGEFLKPYGELGWELVSVQIGSKWYVDETFEVFYLRREL